MTAATPKPRRGVTAAMSQADAGEQAGEQHLQRRHDSAGSGALVWPAVELGQQGADVEHEQRERSVRTNRAEASEAAYLART